MIALNNPEIHLTYCLNIHSGETWNEVLKSISEYTLKVRDKVSPGQPFGIGLRLSRVASDTLIDPENLDRFKTFLNENNLYVFTINGFPYGAFHKIHLKKDVYQPDWLTDERVEYTKQLIHILSYILPQGIPGSISTVPVSFKTWVKEESDLVRVIENLMILVAELNRIHIETGKDICIGLEPEPGCYLETTDDTISFFRNSLLTHGRAVLSKTMDCSEDDAGKMILRHIGVCFDTCHMSIQFEDLAQKLRLLEETGIRLAKIQISSALKTTSPGKSIDILKAFDEPVYLHQVRTRNKNSESEYFNDLPEAIESFRRIPNNYKEARIHFHVPLHFKGDQNLYSTFDDLNEIFFKELVHCKCSNLEIETYTFNVSPEKVKRTGVIDSIAEEIKLVVENIKKIA